MAILSHFEVSIEADGQKVSEYDFPDDDLPNRGLPSTIPNRKIRKYIEVRDKQKLTLMLRTNHTLKLPKSANSVNFKIGMDGKSIRGMINERKNFGTNYRWEDYTTNIAGRMMRNTLRFAVLELNSEDVKGNVQELKSIYDSKGTIEVRVMPYYYEGDKVQKPGKADKHSLSASEKGLKGRAVTLGVDIDVEEVTAKSRVARGFNTSCIPLATFVFEYRTRDSLQQLGIIERSPTPVPLADRDPDTLTPAEIRQLIAELKSKQCQVKQEAKADTKRERSMTANDEDELEVVASKKLKRSSEIIVID